MKIFAANLFNHYHQISHENRPHKNYKNMSLGSDVISFSARRQKTTPEERMTSYANKLLDEKGLKKGQRIYIKGESYYLPFMEILSKEAYKRHSGLVQMDVIEEQLETIKKKYNKTAKFFYEEEKERELKEPDVLRFEFNEENNPYKEARVMKIEAKEEKEKKYFKLPPQIAKLFRIKPKEICKDALDIHEGQPVLIIGEREQIPLIKKIMTYLYSQNKSELIEVSLTDENTKNLLLYGDRKALKEFPKYRNTKAREFYEKDVAQIRLYGQDPNEYESVKPERINIRRKASQKDYDYNLSNYNMSIHCPWVIYYAPTTMSAKDGYPELADDKIALITKAYEDANKINRIGELKKHIQTLNYRSEKLNELLKRGYRTFEYISYDPKTQEPDGRTNFRIKMSPKSKFQSGAMNMPKYGHKPIVNVPTEEVFTAPLKDTAEGNLTSTAPLSLNGQTINGLKFKFKKGKVVDVKANTNAKSIITYIAQNEGANQLGEVAIVAGSPIAQMNRLFNNVLLDENASCHLALGYAFPDTVEGASEISSYQEQNDYLKKENINISQVHTDFMIGDKNIIITAINEETGDKIEIVKNDKFLL